MEVSLASAQQQLDALQIAFLPPGSAQSTVVQANAAIKRRLQALTEQRDFAADAAQGLFGPAGAQAFCGHGRTARGCGDSAQSSASVHDAEAALRAHMADILRGKQSSKADRAKAASLFMNMHIDRCVVLLRLA